MYVYTKHLSCKWKKKTWKDYYNCFSFISNPLFSSKEIRYYQIIISEGRGGRTETKTRDKGIILKKYTHMCTTCKKGAVLSCKNCAVCVMLWHWSFCRENYFSRNALCSIIIIVVSSTTPSSSSYPSQEYGMTSVKVSI